MSKRSNWGLRLALAAVLAIVITACGTPQSPQPPRPNAFGFTAVTGAEPGAVVRSNIATLAGFTGELEATIEGGTLILNDEVTETPVNVSSGDVVAVEVETSAEYETQVTATLTVGSFDAAFRVTTRAASTTPNEITFEAATGVEPGASVDSTAHLLSGFDGELQASVTGAQLVLNDEVVTTPVSVSSGDTVVLRVAASSEYETESTATLTVGTVEGTFSVTTRAASTTPSAIEFTDVDDADLGDLVVSNDVTLAGFDGELEANVTGGSLILNGAPATTPVNVAAGDIVALEVTAAAAYETGVTATLTVGTVSGEFTVTTKASPAVPAILSFTAPSTDVEPGADVELSWDVEGDIDGLTLAGPGLTGAVDVLSESGYTVTIPTGVADVSYTLTATNAELGAGATATETLDLDIPLWVCEDLDQVITFPDAALEAALRLNVISIPDTGPIACSAMRNMTEFDSNHYDGNEGTIASLVGLQHAVNLETLIVQFNQISDLSPIANLTSLDLINFDRNLVTDLTPIAGLTALTELGFWDNGPTPGASVDGISDISALAGLTNLEVVYLSNNNISDLSALSGMTSLRVLYAIGNNISDLTPLAGLTDLRTLRLGFQETDGSISSIAPLAGLTNLSWLELQFTRPSDISLLGDLERLHAVDLEGMLLSNAQIAPLINNLDFPDAAVVPTDLGVGAPTDSALGLAGNCLVTTDPITIASLAALELRGATVTGFTAAAQESCVDGAGSDSLEVLKQRSLDALRESGNLR